MMMGGSTVSNLLVFSCMEGKATLLIFLSEMSENEAGA